MRPETDRQRVVAKLKAEGWISEGGARHEKFSHPERRHKIMVPRHNPLTPGVARSIAKAAGW